MRLRAILNEAFLNIISGATGLALYAAILVAVIAVFGGVDILTVGNIEHQANSYRSSGSSTLIYRMKDSISGKACESLRQIPAVSAAGAIRRDGVSAVALVLPDQQIPTYEVSPNFGGFRALGSVRSGAGILASQDLARTLGLRAGSRLDARDGAARVSGIFSYATDGRLPGYGYSIMVPTDSRAPFDECWVEAWPVTEELTAILPTVLEPGTVLGTANTPGPQLQQLNASHGTRFEGAMLFDDRITRFTPALGGIVASALAFAAVFRRKIELASARHAGVLPSAQATQIAVETVIWAIVGVTGSVFPIGVVVVIQYSSDPLLLWILAGRVDLAAVSGTLLGALAAVCTIRERSLFSYFKARQ